MPNKQTGQFSVTMLLVNISGNYRDPSLRSGFQKQPTQELRNNPHSLPHFLQHFQSAAELVLCMRGGHDGAQTRLAFRNRGESDPRDEDAFLKQLAAELHRQLALANNDWRDGSFASRCISASDVEAEQTQLFLEEPCI